MMDMLQALNAFISSGKFDDWYSEGYGQWDIHAFESSKFRNGFVPTPVKLKLSEMVSFVPTSCAKKMLAICEGRLSSTDDCRDCAHSNLMALGMAACTEGGVRKVGTCTCSYLYVYVL